MKIRNLHGYETCVHSRKRKQAPCPFYHGSEEAQKE